MLIIKVGLGPSVGDIPAWLGGGGNDMDENIVGRDGHEELRAKGLLDSRKVDRHRTAAGFWLWVSRWVQS